MRSLLLSVCLLLINLYVYSQCTPNTSITNSGILPDSATGFVSGVVGQPYNQVVQLRVPPDTVITIGTSPQTVQIISSQLNTFSGLPPGLSFACNPSNCTFPGGSNGCVLISGTPTTAGTFNLLAILQTNGQYLIFPITRQDTIDYYKIVIANSTTGLSNPGKLAFDVDQNTPNPFSDFTNINYTVPHRTQLEFRVFNLIGKEVYHSFVDAMTGKSSFEFDGRELSPGVYLYSLSDGTNTQTKRLIISRK